MSIFEAYDTEFSSLKQEIAKNIAEFRESGDDSDRSVALGKLVEGLLLQSSDLIKQMEIETRSSEPSSRKVLNERVLQYKKATQALKNDFQTTRSQFEKAALVGVSKSMEQRQRLLDANDRYLIITTL